MKKLYILFALAPVPLLALGLAGAAGQEAAPESEVWTQEQLDAVAEEVRAEVAEMRGHPFLRDMEVRITDKDGLHQALLEEIEKDYSEGRLAGIDVSARMLGLLPPDSDYMEATLAFVRDQVGGFYVPGTDKFFLMESFTGPMARPILAHELTHALEDQLFDLDSALKARSNNSDAGIAYQSLVEGSAMVVMTQWITPRLLSGEIDVADAQAMDQEVLSSMKDAPRFLWLPLLAPYLVGMKFIAQTESVMKAQVTVMQALESGEALPIDEAYRDPPRSMEQVLHPAKYWDPAQRDEPRQIEFTLGDDVPEGWEILYEDTLGELILGILARPFDQRGGLAVSTTAILGIEYTSPISTGWGGDGLALLGKGDERFLRLVTLWDSARDAAEFYGAMYTLLADLEGQVKAVAKLEVSSAKARRRTVELAYGEREDEVVLTIAYGSRKGVVADLRRALRHAERSAR